MFIVNAIRTIGEGVSVCAEVGNILRSFYGPFIVLQPFICASSVIHLLRE